MSSESNSTTVTVPPEYLKPEGLRTLANYLRSSNGVKVRSGIQHEKRVDYFKGKRLIECMLEAKKWPKSLSKITDKDIAAEIANLLIKAQFFHRSEKLEGKKNYLKISKEQVFDELSRYTWIYSGNMTWSHLATGGVIAAVIGFTLLPIWPDIAKRVLWYCSVTFLLFTIVFCTVRMLLFLISWIFGYEFWIFPRLFDETLSFQDSFKPPYTLEKAQEGQGIYRIVLLLAVGGFVFWAASQPTEFDGYLQAQKVFIDDLYSGKLLTDVAHDPKDSFDKMRAKIPKFEELMREDDGGSEDTTNTEVPTFTPTPKSETIEEVVVDIEGVVDDEQLDDEMLEALLNSLPTDE